MVNAKGYLKIIAAFTCFIFLITAVINYIIDPYWQFNFAPSHTIVGVNNQISESSLSHFYSDLMLTRQKKVLHQTVADKVFIGSSRSLSGLNTCAFKNIQKVGLFGISSSQTIQLFESALNNLHVRQLYIELGSLTNNVDVKHTSLTPVEGLFSAHVLTRSLSNFMASMRLPHHQDPLCEVNRASKSMQLQDEDLIAHERERLISKADEFIASGGKLAVEEIARQCRNSPRTKDNALNIVIYFAPFHPNLNVHEISPRLKRMDANIYAHSNFAKKCTIQTYIFERNSAFDQSENWFDLAHYKPIIGNAFLGKMLRNSSK